MFIIKIISKLIYKLNMEMLLITATTSGKGELMIHIQWGRVAIRWIGVVSVV